MKRGQIARLIKSKIEAIGIEELKENYQSSGKINHLIIDNLLPDEIVERLHKQFPPESQLTLLNERQEKKYVGVQFLEHQEIVEECIYAFQDSEIINAFSKICTIEDLEADPELYAGGISSMSDTCFLNPHIDNSHDRLKEKYRRLNLLYYVSKDFLPSDGGQLLLYPQGIKTEPIEIDSRYNRLIVMRTDNKSLHVMTCYQFS